MKILYIITQGEEGGAQRQVRDLALEMTAKGHEVYIATGRQHHDEAWLFREVAQSIPDSRRFIIDSLLREITPRGDWEALKETVALIEKVRPDIVHLHSTKAGIIGTFAGWWAKVPVVYTVHGFVFNEPMGRVRKLAYVFAEWLASWFRAHTIVLSEKDARLGNRYFLLAGEKTSVIFNGIDPLLKQNFLSKEEAREEIRRFAPHVAFPKYVLGTVANLYPTKGLDGYMEALAIVKKKHPNILAVVIGEGPERARLTALRSKLDLERNAIFVGSIPNAYRLLRAFDCFVLPSVKEGAPYVLLEAALSGIPSIATDVGGIREMADRTACMTLIPPRHPKILAEIIAGLIEHDQPIVTNSAWHPLLTLDMMARTTEGVYRQVLKEKKM